MRKSNLKKYTCIVVMVTCMQLCLLIWLYQNVDNKNFYNIEPALMDEPKNVNPDPKFKTDDGIGLKNISKKLSDTVRLQKANNKIIIDGKEVVPEDECFEYPGENSHQVGSPYKVYIYDLPDQFNREIIKCHAKLTTNACRIKMSDCGFGPKIAHVGHFQNIAIRETNQFSLEVIIHHKLLLSPYRTLDPETADIFYVPAYIGLYCLTFNKCSDLPTMHLVERLFEYIKQMPYYAAGKPHFSTLGKIHREQVIPPCDHLQHPYTHNMTFLSIEREDFTHSAYLPKRPKQSIIVVPYPSYAHLSDENPKSTIAVINLDKRDVRIFLAASSHRTNEFRNKIMDEFPERIMNTYYAYTSARPHSQKNMILLDTTKCTLHQRATIPWMTHSVFCLQPPGDSATRKSFYDAIMSGCIPVIFPSKYDIAYPFESELNFTSFTYTIPEARILDGEKVETILNKVPRKKRVELHESVVKVARQLQYSEFKPNIVRHDDAVQLILDELEHLHNL